VNIRSGFLNSGAISALVKRVVESDPGIVAVYLFGSRARDTATEGSDVDLGVLFREATELRDVVLLESELEECLGSGVDLVDVGRCGAFLAVEIIDGERIYCSDPDACDRFELYVLRRAGDLAYFEKQRRESLLRPSGSTP
jgi:predicted nucleotidyltransferase